MPAAARIRVVTWNVHGCVGTDGVRDPGRIAAVLRSIAPDIVGLQEIDCREPASRGADQLELLAEATGLAAIPGPARYAADGCGYFGNALLARFPVRGVTHADLSVDGREPRALLDVTFDAGHAAVRAIVTHFGLHGAERRRQLRAVLDRVADAGDPPTCLLGDFNEWWPRASTLLQLHAAMGRTPAVKSFPSRWPLFALDRIWVAPRRALVDLAAVRSPASRVASDHLPVVATIDLGRV